MAKSWKDYKEDFILILEAGFVAVNQADEDAAVKLFKAAQLLQPQNTMPTVGMGYLHLHKLELKQAISAFEDVLKKEPSNDMAKALLGLCMGLMIEKSEKGEQILGQMAKSENKGIQKLAGTALNFIDKFVKKAPGPAGKNT